MLRLAWPFHKQASKSCSLLADDQIRRVQQQHLALLVVPHDQSPVTLIHGHGRHHVSHLLQVDAHAALVDGVVAPLLLHAGIADEEAHVCVVGLLQVVVEKCEHGTDARPTDGDVVLLDPPADEAVIDVLLGLLGSEEMVEQRSGVDLRDGSRLPLSRVPRGSMRLMLLLQLLPQERDVGGGLFSELHNSLQL